VFVGKDCCLDSAVLEDFLRSETFSGLLDICAPPLCGPAEMPMQDDSGGQRQPRLTVWVLQSCIGRVRQV
jgi:hypothetical protein